MPQEAPQTVSRSLANWKPLASHLESVHSPLPHVSPTEHGSPPGSPQFYF